MPSVERLTFLSLVNLYVEDLMVDYSVRADSKIEISTHCCKFRFPTIINISSELLQQEWNSVTLSLSLSLS